MGEMPGWRVEVKKTISTIKRIHREKNGVKIGPFEADKQRASKPRRSALVREARPIIYSESKRSASASLKCTDTLTRGAAREKARVGRDEDGAGENTEKTEIYSVEAKR